MLRNSRLLGALVVASLVSVSACDNKTTTPTPTPTPAPAPAPAPAPTPPPPAAPAALESITLSASEVPSQGEPTLTIKLTAAAPAGNASINLQSSRDEVKVPSNTSIAAGETSTSLKVEASTVNIRTTATITASYQGVTMSATLTVLPPPLEPRFTISSTQLGSDACNIVTTRGEFDCVLDASSSGGFVATYHWTLSVGSTELKVDRSDAGPFIPAAECAFLGGGSQSDGKVTLTVTLRLEDRQGNFSNNQRRTATLVTNHLCGY